MSGDKCRYVHKDGMYEDIPMGIPTDNREGGGCAIPGWVWLVAIVIVVIIFWPS